MITSLKIAKDFDKNPTKSTPFHVLEKLGIQWTNLNLIETVYSEPIASINLREEELEATPLKSGTIQSCLFSP